MLSNLPPFAHNAQIARKNRHFFAKYNLRGYLLPYILYNKAANLKAALLSGRFCGGRCLF
jgi:hypothetical protein